MNNERGALTFPCDFMIKIIGLHSDQFEIEVLSMVRKYVHDLKEDSLKTRLSKDSKYLSMSITINAKSQEQLDNIYKELTANPNVLMAL